MTIGAGILFPALFVTLTILSGPGASLLLAAEDAAQEKPSPELIREGEALFNQKESFQSKFACILCHKGEKAIKRDKVLKRGGSLAEVINKQIVVKSKGKPVAAGSHEMKALIAYIIHEHSK